MILDSSTFQPWPAISKLPAASVAPSAPSAPSVPCLHDYKRINVEIPPGFDDLRSVTRDDVLCEMTRLLVTTGKLAESLAKPVAIALQRREDLGSTVVTNSVAIPHIRLDGIPSLLCVMGRSVNGIQYEAVKGRRTHLLFLVMSSKWDIAVHLDCLAALSHAVRDREKMFQLICERDPSKLRALAKNI